MPLVSVIPDKVDYPFYMMIAPFKRSNSIDEWASRALTRKGSFQELEDELRRDPDWSTDIKALRQLVRIRFPKAELSDTP